MRCAEKFNLAIQQIDRLHRSDPSTILVNGVSKPAELAYAERVSAKLLLVCPNPSEELRLAVRCQHLERWAVPRDSYPDGRNGYRKWRTDLARRQADLAARILREAGYNDDVVNRVGCLIRKQQIKADAETQALEDAACLVFLEYHLDEFATQHPEEKLKTILRKTWSKMSQLGRERALETSFSPELARIINDALADSL